jgi:hypothetical protein
MVFYLPESIETATSLDELTPRQIVTELDKYVIGQNEAKRCVATALRNRMRRQKLPPEQAEDILPKNIHRRGEDRDRAPPGSPDEFSVSQSGSFAFYRSRLRWP